MRDLARFATEDWPLHPSGMRMLMVCSWSTVLRYLAAGELDDEGGTAGDTGSAMHKAAAELHRGKDLAACIEAMHSGLSSYPKADLTDAAGLFLKYATDPRNRTAEIILVEEQIRFQIAPAPEDKTQAPIVVEGTVDQVRRLDTGELCVGDIKTTRKPAEHALMQATFQVAAYMVGASIHLGKPVQRAMLIMPRLYRADTATSPVFRHYPWKIDSVEHILAGLRHRVAAVRNAQLYHVPNDACQYCPGQHPDLCLPKLIQLKAKL